MPIGEICTRDVVVASPDISVKAAAELMREYHVGCVVLVREHDGRRMPVGLITDRDIVVAVVALGLDPSVIRAGDIAAPKLIELHENAGVADAAATMRTRGVRRLPVVDKDGTLVGLLAADDLLELLAEELTALAQMIARERKREIAERRSHPLGHA